MDAWESREQRDRSMGTYMPAFQEAGISMETIDRAEGFQIHSLKVRK